MMEQYDSPTLRNVRLRTLEDSIKIALATQAGVLKAVTTRLAERGPTCIQPGDIYVFVEGGEIIRWTDGFRQSSASRTRQQFLCYIIPSTPSRPKMCRKRCKHELPTAGGGKEIWHVVAYDYDDETAYGRELRFIEDVDEFPRALASGQLPTPPPEETSRRIVVSTSLPHTQDSPYRYSMSSPSREASTNPVPSSSPPRDGDSPAPIIGDATFSWKHFDHLPVLPEPSSSMVTDASDTKRNTRRWMDDDMLFRLK